MSLQELKTVSESLAAELEEQPSAWTRRMQRRKNRAGANKGAQKTDEAQEPKQGEGTVEAKEQATDKLPPTSAAKEDTVHRESSGAVAGKSASKIEANQASDDSDEDPETELDEEAQAASKMRRALQALRDRRVELDTVQADLDAAHAESDALQEQLQEVRAELESEREGRQKALDELAAECKARFRVVEEANASKATVATELKKERTKVASLEKDMEVLRKQVADVSALRASEANLQKQLGAVREQLAAKGNLSEETKALRNELEASKTEVEQQKAQKEKFAKDCKELRNSLTELLAGNKFLQQKLDETKVENDDTKKQKASLQDEAKVNKTQLTVARQEIHEARAKHKDYTAAAGAKLEELRKLKTAWFDARAEFERSGGSWTATSSLEGLKVALDAAIARTEAGTAAASVSSPGGQRERQSKRPGATSAADPEASADVGDHATASDTAPVELKSRNHGESAAEGAADVSQPGDRHHKRRREKGDKASRKERKERKDNDGDRPEKKARVELKERKERREEAFD
jgi:uncharacterized coiled-coil DUF342 family protein